MIYAFPYYVVAIPVIVAVIAISVGILFVWRRSSFRSILISFLVAIVAGGLFAPGMASDRVLLDEERLEQTTGFWFAPTIKGFNISDAEKVSIVKRSDSRGREYDAWVVAKKSGDVEEIDPGDLWVMNTDDIVQRLRKLGVAVER